MDNLTHLIDLLGEDVRQYVTSKFDSFTKRFEDYDRRLGEILARQPERGEPGLPGPKGESIVGPAGPAGPAGAMGPRGERGESGISIKGERGDAGPIGPKGDPGESITGPAGPRGERGESVIGPIGPQGPRGERGESITGPAGVQGERGADGRSPELDQIVAAVLPRIPVPRDGRDGESIVGPPGPKGERGESIIGPAGPQGERGVDGRTPELEYIVAAVLPKIPIPRDGRDGVNGRDGESIKGERGERGEPGRDGRDGLDASEINILPAIDESKTYPRGTVGQMRGGLSRFDGTTWNSIVRGVDKVLFEISEANPRLAHLRIIYSNGDTDELPVRRDVVMYQGVYSADREYERGDLTTHGGSMWHCEHKTSSLPGKNGDWKLAVKRGTDGKDGKTGERGERGPAGQDLRYK